MASRGRARLTERDLELLEMAAEHRLILGEHAQACLGVSAARARARLSALAAAGYLRRDQFLHAHPSHYQITRRGLGAVGRSYRAPGPDLGTYQHDVGLAWLWLAAQHGTFGPLREMVSERAMRSHDGRPEREAEPFGVRLGGHDSRGRERLHYPDLVLVTADGRRVAVELELTSKTRRRRESILAGYAADRRIDAVLYLVQRRGVGEPIRACARGFGISDRVHVQRVSMDKSAKRGSDRVASRVVGRAAQEVGR